jgi:transcriptional regulator with XRE-family HTH domain
MKTIRQLREAKGLTPVELAATLKVSLATVYNWEAGKHEPRASQLRDLARLFRVPMEEIAIPGVDTARDDPGA